MKRGNGLLHSLPKNAGPGRPRTVDIREIANAIFYLIKPAANGNAATRFPGLPSRQLLLPGVDTQRRLGSGAWTALRELARVVAGKQPSQVQPLWIVSRSKTTGHSEARGYDAGKQVKGRKRHIVVDTLGLLFLVMVTSASIQDRDGGVELCDEVQQQLCVSRRSGLTAPIAVNWLSTCSCGVALCSRIVKRPAEQRGFQVQPKRWIVERTLSWLNPFRR